MTDGRSCLKLNDAFGQVDDRFLDLVERERRRKPRKRIIAWTRFGAVAAAACLIAAIPVWAQANGWLGLKGLLLYEENRGIEDGAGERLVEELAERATFVSLSGYQDSVESQALAEWETYVEEYTATHKIDNEFDSTVDVNAMGDWTLYQVYSLEMGEKLEEIAAKYGLRLHTDIEDMSPELLASRIGGEYLAGNGERYWGYMYEDGSFQMEGTAVLDGGAVVADYQFRRVVKGTLDEVVLNIGDADSYTDWQYTTAGGEKVLLALDMDKALIFADLESCFVTVNVLGGSASGMMRENLEELADMVNLKLLQ